MKIGLEIHSQIKTERKLFSNAFCYKENNCSIFDCGISGTLPILNQEAIFQALKIAKALNCVIPQTLQFDRKHYTYHDLPKGYQITQFFEPLGKNGNFEIFLKNYEKFNVLIKQIHVEQDSAKTSYNNNSFTVEYKRANLPLIELVTEPCFSSEEEVKFFIKAYINLLKINDVFGANIEDGGLRCDVNISNKVSDRAEIKNLNSLSNICKAINVFQKKTLEEGKNFSNFTLAYLENENDLKIIRKKESTSLYRHIPEFNIPFYNMIGFAKKDDIFTPFDSLWRFFQIINLKVEDAYLINTNALASSLIRQMNEKYKEQAVYFILENIIPYEHKLKEFSLDYLIKIVTIIFILKNEFNLTKLDLQNIFLKISSYEENFFVSKEQIVNVLDLKKIEINIKEIEKIIHENNKGTSFLQDKNKREKFINFIIGKVKKENPLYNIYEIKIVVNNLLKCL